MVNTYATTFDNFGATWTQTTTAYGVYSSTVLTWDTNDVDEYGIIYNDDIPLLIWAENYDSMQLVEVIAGTGEMLIGFNETGGDTYTVTVYMNEVNPAYEIFNYSDTFTGPIDYISLHVRFFTSGLMYNMFNVGYSYGGGGDTEYAYVSGYKDGKLDGIIQGEINGYKDGVYDVFNYGVEWTGLLYDVESSYDYNKGQDDMDTYGGVIYGYDTDNDGYPNTNDYFIGFNHAQDISVNESIINFNNGLQKWIVPAIITVMTLGGFYTFRRMKKDQGQGD
jgi:hypothetical protein